MAKVFISHSWHDNDIAKKIADNLKRDGAEIWIDYATIKSGAIPVRISQALEWCDTMVLIWSKASAESYYVGLEWQSALDLQKAIIPCIIDDTKRPAILRGFLFIDFRNFERGYQQLFQALELKREKPATQPSKPVEKVEEKREQEKPKKPETKTVDEPVHRERIQKKEKQVETPKQPIPVKEQAETQKKAKKELPKKSVRNEKVYEKQKITKIAAISVAIFIIGFITIYIINKMKSKGEIEYQPTEQVTEQKLSEDSPQTQIAKDIEWIPITGGTFEMGDTFGDGYDDEKPVHTVTVSDFYMSKTEVTVAQYRNFCQATGRTMPDVPSWGWKDNHPIVRVSWNDAVAFCEWAECRLPTEAEWEYAAREGGKKVRFGNGKDIADPAEINFDGRAEYKKDYSVVGIYRKKTTPVASFAPNALGLYDMSGNVWEWCSDWYDENYFKNSPGNNPKGPTNGRARVLRGGSWYNTTRYCRSTDRYRFNPFNWNANNGFRVVRDSPQ